MAPSQTAQRVARKAVSVERARASERLEEAGAASRKSEEDLQKEAEANKERWNSERYGPLVASGVMENVAN